MAKGKHSAALFEVIHSAKKPECIAQRMRTPKWWFKGNRTSAIVAPSAEPVTSETDPTAPQLPSQAPAFDRTRSSTAHLGFDRGRQELTFRLRYTTVLVSGFAICVLVGLAYVVGRHLGHGPQTASAAEQPSIEQLKQLPANPNVINVTKTKRSAPPADGSHVPLASSNSAASRQLTGNSLVPKSAYTQLPRKLKLDYVIIGVYPTGEEARAKAARDFFTAHGVPCTLAKTTWAPQWISLVGTAGFPSLSDPDLKLYQLSILKAAGEMKSSFDKPSNLAVYPWKSDDHDL